MSLMHTQRLANGQLQIPLRLQKMNVHDLNLLQLITALKELKIFIPDFIK